MGFGKGVAMKRWMKWAAVAAVGLVAVPVMGLSMAPSKPVSKTAAKPAAKMTAVSKVDAKKTTKLAAKPVQKNLSPRPASVRLGKNAVPTKTKGHGQLSTTAHATPAITKISTKTKPVMVTRTPVKPTTLHTGPAKLPTPKSTLSKAMEKTHTPSSPTKSKPTNLGAKAEMN
jgi:hypothetical protein